MRSQNENGQIITLPIYNIFIVLPNEGGGTITSVGLKVENVEDHEDMEYNSAIDAVESLILAHAIAGVEVDSPEYIEGLETTLDAICNLQ